MSTNLDEVLFGDIDEDRERQIEYVIYCRKSTDESSKKQASSIPRQIDDCVNFAEREGYKIRKKPDNFEFESTIEIASEDNEPDLEDRRIYKKYRDLYIIRERESGKKPGVRKKWTRLMKLVGEGKIKGVISYSPDRQARNLLEAGQLIDFVDNGIVALKYPNFAFEPNAAGKMMLGIWFVFSKQYSDKLGEDSSAGTARKVLEGKSVGSFKYGYLIDEEGYHYPHPSDFKYMKEAFQMKLRDNESDEKIAEWLQEKRVGRTYKTSKNFEPISARTVNDLWKESFYYGIFEYGAWSVDLREKNPHYEPLITEEEAEILMERYYERQPHSGKKEVKDEFQELMPLNERFIKTVDDSYLSFNIPNRARFNKKLEALKISNPDASLKDVVLANQIRFSCKNKESKLYLTEFTFDQIESVIVEKLKHFKVTEEAFAEYRAYVTGRLKEKIAETTARKRSIQRDINRNEDKLRDYILKNASLKKDVAEERVYEGEKKRLETLGENMRIRLSEFDTMERNKILEFEAFCDLFNNPEQTYKNTTYVRKRKIASILFSNILLTHEKALQIQVKPGLEGLFSNDGRGEGRV